MKKPGGEFLSLVFFHLHSLNEMRFNEIAMQFNLI
jgi:hypothetical protein